MEQATESLGSGNNGSERLELHGLDLGACAAPPCILDSETTSPLAVIAEATLRFRANSSRAYAPRCPGGGRFILSFKRVAAQRRAAPVASTSPGIDATPAPAAGSSPRAITLGSELLTLSVSGDAGLEPPCSFTYGPGRAILRLARANVSTWLEGDWLGTTVARVQQGGPFARLSSGRCIESVAAGTAPTVASSAESCATLCLGNPECGYFTFRAGGECVWSAACSILFVFAPWCSDLTLGCPEPDYTTYQRRHTGAQGDVKCGALLSVRGPAVQVHVHSCPSLGGGPTSRQSEQEGLLRGMVLEADRQDAECYGASVSARPCLYDLSTEGPAERSVRYWRMKVRGCSAHGLLHAISRAVRGGLS